MPLRRGALPHRGTGDAGHLCLPLHALPDFERIAFALQMPVKLDRLAVEGEVLSVELPTASGAVSDIRHCPACLTRLYGVSSAVPGIAIMRAGTLDDSASLVPGLHVFTSTKQPWIALPEGVPAFAESPPARSVAAVAGLSAGAVRFLPPRMFRSGDARWAAPPGWTMPVFR